MDWGLLALALMVAGGVWAYIARLRRDEALRAAEREGYQRRTVADPQNAGAHEALGDSLRAAGQLQEAREAYLAALTAAGDGPLGPRLEYRLRQLDRDIRERAARQTGRSAKPAPDLYFCPRCGGANVPTRRVCETCGAELPHDRFGAALRDKEVLRASAEAGACLLVMAAALTVAAAQPLDVKGCLVMATVIVVGWRFLQALGPCRL